jgi:L-cystine uptake protein TcyP (sodium:dicarboxylate symporter family)
MPIEKWPKGPTNLAREPLRVTAIPLQVAGILAVVTKVVDMTASVSMITVIMLMAITTITTMITIVVEVAITIHANIICETETIVPAEEEVVAAIGVDIVTLCEEVYHENRISGKAG